MSSKFKKGLGMIEFVLYLLVFVMIIAFAAISSLRGLAISGQIREVYNAISYKVIYSNVVKLNPDVEAGTKEIPVYTFFSYLLTQPEYIDTSKGSIDTPEGTIDLQETYKKFDDSISEIVKVYELQSVCIKLSKGDQIWNYYPQDCVQGVCCEIQGSAGCASEETCDSNCGVAGGCRVYKEMCTSELSQACDVSSAGEIFIPTFDNIGGKLIIGIRI